MARFNTGARTLVISGTTTLSYAFTGGIVTLSGAGTYTVTVASPVSFPGTTQLFYNGSSAAITLATPVGQIRGPGFTNGAFQTIEAGASMTLVSDGSNYIISNTEGNIVVGTSATFSGTLIAATQLGSAASGGTQIIRGTSHATKAAASILMNDNVASTGTSSGTLVITGGLGVSGRINASNFDGIVGANSAAAGTFTTVSCTSLTETSSIALKENIQPIENALDKILALTGYIYDRKDGSAQNEAGLIKEEVEQIIPNIVSGDGIHYTKLGAYLIESVKSLHKEILELKSKL